MNRIDALCKSYASYISLPWEKGLSGVQKVCFAVYDKDDERRLRKHIDEFELATREGGHDWVLVDLSNAFGTWMNEHKFREEYFEDPELLDSALAPFHEHCSDLLRAGLTSEPVDEDTVVAVYGVGSLFGFMRVSQLVNSIHSDIRGRLLVFFPGEYEAGKNTYRLLDAKDGWNYMAVPITAN